MKVRCLNCDTENPEGTKHCVECGANLTTKKYSKADDPHDARISKLETNFKKLVEALNEDEEESETPVPEVGTDGKPKPKPAGGKKRKRRFLFD